MSTTEIQIYTIYVKTSDQQWAGTDDDVHIQLTGSYGESEKIILDNKFHDDFERDHMDTFEIKSAFLGKLESVGVVVKYVSLKFRL